MGDSILLHLPVKETALMLTSQLIQGSRDQKLRPLLVVSPLSGANRTHLRLYNWIQKNFKREHSIQDSSRIAAASTPGKADNIAGQVFTPQFGTYKSLAFISSRMGYHLHELLTAELEMKARLFEQHCGCCTVYEIYASLDVR